MIIFYTEKTLTFHQLLLCLGRCVGKEGGQDQEGGYGKETFRQDFEGRNDGDDESINKKKDDKDSADDGDDGWDDESGQGRVGTGPRTEKATRVGIGRRGQHVTIIIINKFGLRI